MKRFVLILIFFSMVWGCAAQQDIVILDDRLAAFDQRMEGIERRCLHLENQLGQVQSQNEADRKKRADEDISLRNQFAEIRVLVDQLRTEMQALTGLSEENRHLLSQKGKFLEDTEGKMSKLFEQIEEQNFSLKNRVARLEQYLNLEVAEPAKSDKSPRPSDAAALSENELYAAAKANLDKGNYQGAREGFILFIQRYPRSEQADNAQFWIGESYYREKWYEKAILEYQNVIEKYPKGNKVAAALLKQGLSFLMLGDKANSSLILKELVKKYPDTTEAKIAGEKLKQM